MRSRQFLTALGLAALLAGPAAAASMAPPFAREAARGGTTEVELGRMAADRASDPQVRDFAQRMVDDHTRANDQLERIARDRGWMLPQAPDPEHRSEMRRMSTLRGRAFDRAYMRAMTSDHDADVAQFRRYVRNGNDPQLRRWARRTLPTLEEHRQLAHQTMSSL